MLRTSPRRDTRPTLTWRAVAFADRLLRHLPGAEKSAQLDDALATAIASARSTWPAIELADDDFLAYLAARLPSGALTAAVRATCVADLWLAFAIGRGDPAALAIFEGQLLRDVGAAIGHLDGGSALADDVTVAVRERVLAVDAGGKAKIGDYRGRGDLRGWLRVVAVREALQLLRKRKREAPLGDDLADRLDEGVASALSSNERRVYRESFAAALATLTPRERNLLRQQYVYGTTIDELGALYGVHRATAARWLAQIRDTVLHRTREHVGAALRLTGDDLDSAMQRIASQLDVTLRHTLSMER